MNSVLSSIVGSSLVIFFGVVEITGTERGGTPKTEVVVAHQVSDFVLPDSTGTQLSLADFGDAKLVVVVFMGTACPIANGYVPYLNELQERYRDQKVQVIGINSNLSDSPESIAKHVKELDRKSTRLNSSHVVISYAVFCLKKKKTKTKNI